MTIFTKIHKKKGRGSISYLDQKILCANIQFECKHGWEGILKG